MKIVPYGTSESFDIHSVTVKALCSSVPFTQAIIFYLLFKIVE